MFWGDGSPEGKLVMILDISEGKFLQKTPCEFDMECGSVW